MRWEYAKRFDQRSDGQVYVSGLALECLDSACVCVCSHITFVYCCCGCTDPQVVEGGQPSGNTFGIARVYLSQWKTWAELGYKEFAPEEGMQAELKVLCVLVYPLPDHSFQL